MHDQHDLSLILDSRVPIIVVETHDEQRFLESLVAMVTGSGTIGYRPLFRWTVTDGLQRLDIQMEPQPTNADPEQALRHIRSVEQPGIYALLDFHPYLADPVHVRLLKDFATQRPCHLFCKPLTKRKKLTKLLRNMMKRMTAFRK